MTDKRVVVTGLGAITPLGLDHQSTWQACLKGVSGAGPITKFDASGYKTRIAAELRLWDALDLWAGHWVMAAGTGPIPLQPNCNGWRRQMSAEPFGLPGGLAVLSQA